jgi:two-component system, OmpR family, sensor kinase
VRSAGRYAAWPLVALIVVIVIGTYGAIRAVATSRTNAVADEARSVPALYRVYRTKYHTIAEAGPPIARALSRDGIRAFVFARDGDRAYGPDGELQYRKHGGFPMRGPGGPGGPGGPDPVVMLVASLGGVNRTVVPVGDAEIHLLPDPRGLTEAIKLLAGAAFLLIVVLGIALWAIARSVTAAAARPLKETTEALWRLAERDFTPRMIVADSRSDVGKLAGAYNAAAETVAHAIEERRGAEAEMQRFIADAGHELRTPLTIVMGFVDVLDGGRVPPEVGMRIFNAMRSETRRMRGLIDKLITLARLESPQDGFAIEPVDPGEIAARVAESLATVAGGRAIRIDAKTDAEVIADEHELFEAIYNCVENALKYAPDSEVLITLENESDAVAVRVADRGPGMTSEERRHAFERFYRGDMRGEVSGSGLGLAIVKRAVERVGGSTRIDSAPGEGTCVTLTLPLAPALTARVSG